MRIDHNYLPQQFANRDSILAKISEVVRRGDFTLGKEVGEFEQAFAKMVGVRHAIGVGNGTDALELAMEALQLKGSVVITSPYSFYATTASIFRAGATPRFVDVRDDFNIDPNKIEDAVTNNTRALVIVHWAGRPCDMDAIMDICKRRGLFLIEDCAHAPGSTWRGKKCGSFGHFGTFSLHPLKNVNVWGDGGVVVTNKDSDAERIRQLRNHGMRNRNVIDFWGRNSRLDTIQAVVAHEVLNRIDDTTAARRRNAEKLTSLLNGIPEVTMAHEYSASRSNYYLFSFHAENRDALVGFLNHRGVDAKVHYPVPLHLQPAAESISKFKRGDFPVAEWCADTTVSLPVHDWITDENIKEMGELVRRFYEDQRGYRGLCEGV